MGLLGSIRPDDWNVDLFLHVLGAMVLVGGLLLAALYLWGAWRNGDRDRLRLGLRALLFAAIPGYVLMRVFAQLIYDQEGIGDQAAEPSWIGIGFIVGDIGLLLMLAATLCAGIAVRKAGGATLVRVATGLISLLLIADVVAIWAMTTKPV